MPKSQECSQEWMELQSMPQKSKRNLKTPVKTRTLHLSEPYNSRSTPHTDKAEPVEPAPIAQSAELQRTVVAATEDGSDATNQVGHEAANDDGYQTADDWIEVPSKHIKFVWKLIEWENGEATTNSLSTHATGLG